MHFAFWEALSALPTSSCAMMVVAVASPVCVCLYIYMDLVCTPPGMRFACWVALLALPTSLCAVLVVAIASPVCVGLVCTHHLVCAVPNQCELCLLVSVHFSHFSTLGAAHIFVYSDSAGLMCCP